jgi:hypothetical protein
MKQYEFEEIVPYLIDHLPNFNRPKHISKRTLLELMYISSTGVEYTTIRGEIIYEEGQKLVLFGMHNAGLFEDEVPFKVTGFGRFSKIRFTGKNTQRLIQQAETDSIAWDALKRLIILMQDQGELLPVELREFNKKVLRGHLPKKPRGQHPHENAVRDFYITSHIMELNRLGFGPITTHMIESDTLSICQAVEKATAYIKTPLSYEAIKKIYLKNKKFVEAVFNGDSDAPIWAYAYRICGIDCKKKLYQNHLKTLARGPLFKPIDVEKKIAELNKNKR